MRTSSATLLIPVALLLIPSCDTPSPAERGPLHSGKADTTGSCSGSCDDVSPDGCWCDAECSQYGDCCPDIVSECGLDQCQKDQQCPQGQSCEPTSQGQLACGASNPCEDIVCNAPPEAHCEDDQTRRSYAATGTCEQGHCRYLVTDETCPEGCEQGECVSASCDKSHVEVCAPEIIANNQNVRGIALDRDFVYVTTVSEESMTQPPYTGSILRIGKDGIGFRTLATGQGRPQSLVVDDTWVYWVNQLADEVMRVAKDGSSAPEILASGQDGAADIAVDDTHIYWVNTNSNQVMRMNKAGTAPEQIGNYQWPAGIALDDTHVYVVLAIHDAGWVLQIPKAGGGATTIANGQHFPTRIAVDASHAYWTNLFGDQVRRAPKGGGGPVETIAESNDLDNPRGIAVDDYNAYWTSAHFWNIDHANRIFRRHKNGAVVQELATAQHGAFDLAVDGTHLYWTNEDANEVVRTPLCGCP